MPSKVKCIDLWRSPNINERERAITYIDFKKRERSHQERRDKNIKTSDRRRGFMFAGLDEIN
jgi:hypothetical protein